jgi:endoglucanase
MGRPAYGARAVLIRRQALLVCAAFAIATFLLMPIGARASNGTVLILDSSVSNGLGSDEAQAATNLGFTVNVVDAATWTSMTTADFSTYAAIILGDPTCSGSPSTSVGAAEANASTWGAAVNGNVSIVGTDPVFHHMFGLNNSGSLKVTTDAVAYALARPGTTGAYISLSCYYEGAESSVAPPVLSGLAGGGFSVHGYIDCWDSGYVETDVATASVSWTDLTDKDLRTWGCSIHETFDSWPSAFTPLAIDPSARPATFTDTDGVAGQPYILVSGQGSCVSAAVTPDSTDPGKTHLVGSCFAPGESVDVLLNTEAGAILVDRPTVGADGVFDDTFALPDHFDVPLPNGKGFHSVAVPLQPSAVYQLDVIGERAADGASLQVQLNASNALTSTGAAPHTTSGPGCVPATVSALPPLPARGPLHTNGRWIVDQTESRVKLASVNWYGAEQADFIPGGLYCQSVDAIAARIRNAPFNSVRLPWSNAMLEENPGPCSATPTPLGQPCISPGLLLANPGLAGKDAIGIYRAVVQALGKLGVMVVLDNHTTDAQWSPGAKNGIWWGGALWDDFFQSAQCAKGDSFCSRRRIVQWKNDWITMVNLFQAEPNVVGVDLRNEPNDDNSYGVTENWCSSCSNDDSPVPVSPSASEWGQTAAWAGNAILAVDPQLLIIVEGLKYSQDLTNVYHHWIALQQPGHVVYSPHSYGNFSFNAGFFRNYSSLSRDELATALGNSWGYIVTQGQDYTAPVWVGEFGDCNTTDGCASAFLSNFIAYLGGADFDWAYWAINGTMSDGGSSGRDRTWFAEEKYGILKTTWSAARETSLVSNLPIGCVQGRGC